MCEGIRCLLPIVLSYSIHRCLLAYIYVPVLQQELDTFKEKIWNSHRIRQQKDTNLPSGVPDHIYSFPAEYGLEECGIPVTEDMLRKVAELSHVYEVGDNYLPEAFMEECQHIIAKPEDIKPKDCVNAFIYLKENYSNVH